MKARIRKILKIAGLTVVLTMALVLIAHSVGRGINNIRPIDGINESMFVQINGTRQWLNIYGKDEDNPVLLYLHGGPGSSTSPVDYAFTRKWADVYTVVTWDQRNCGKSYSKENNRDELTYDLFMQDGKEITEFILDHLHKEKLTVLGHSWGSIYGANLVQAFPEHYDCFIGTGQLVDSVENEIAFRNAASQWAAGDDQAMFLVDLLTPEKMTLEHITARNTLMKKYGYDMMRDGSDYNLIFTVLFNPHYSVIDWVKCFQADMGGYLDFFASDEFKKFSIQGRYDYEVPYFNINGDEDYQTNHTLAEDYFHKVKAPFKKLYIMEHTTHGLLESKSEEFSEYIHEIFKLTRWR